MPAPRATPRRVTADGPPIASSSRADRAMSLAVFARRRFCRGCSACSASSPGLSDVVRGSSTAPTPFRYCPGVFACLTAVTSLVFHGGIGRLTHLLPACCACRSAIRGRACPASRTASCGPVRAENLFHHAIFMNHATSAITPAAVTGRAFTCSMRKPGPGPCCLYDGHRLGSKRAAAKTRSRTSSGVSTRGSMGSVTPMKIRALAGRCSAMIPRTFSWSASLASWT